MRENGDHLGSASLALNAAGTAVTADQRTYAWGNARYESGALPTSRYFTGHLKDATGLYFYNARHYDPTRSLWRNPKLVRAFIYAGGWDRHTHLAVHYHPETRE